MITQKESDSPAETSQQGTLLMMQQDLLGHKEGVNDKLSRLQETMELLMGGMERMMAEDELKRVENFENEEKLVKEEITASAQSKGMFRDPLHAALARKRVEQGDCFDWMAVAVKMRSKLQETKVSAKV